jgi:hypothetical protein
VAFVRVARRGDLSHAEVAADFDVSVESVRRLVRQTDVDDGVVDGQTSAEQNELVQLRRDKRRLECWRGATRAPRRRSPVFIEAATKHLRSPLEPNPAWASASPLYEAACQVALTLHRRQRRRYGAHRGGCDHGGERPSTGATRCMRAIDLSSA